MSKPTRCERSKPIQTERDARPPNWNQFRSLRRILRPVSTSIFAALVTSAAAAGPIMLDPRPEDSSTLFGRAIAVIGDIDADGVPDLAVGAPFQDGDFENTDTGFGHPQNVGKVYVVSGATLAILSTLNDPEFQMVQSQKFGGQFGSVVAAAGDLNGDGSPDVLVGTPHHVVLGDLDIDNKNSAGRVFACSGKDGSVLLTLDDPTAEENGRFGSAVASVGDVNHDGVPDILVGVPGKDTNGHSNVGIAYIFSGVDGSFIRTINHPFQGTDKKEDGAAFGSAVANAGDLNHDGVPEALISAPGGGQVFVFNVRTGGLIFTLNSPTKETEPSFGAAVAGGLDLDGDGIPDFAVGAPLQNNAAGRAYIFGGKDGHLLKSMRSSLRERQAKFGASVLLSKDVTGDGVVEVLVGAPEETVNGLLHAGEVFIFDGARGRLLKSLTSVTPQPFAGFSLALATFNVSGSQVDTVAIGTPLQNADIMDDDGDIITHLQIGQLEIQ
jgi:hypothetical protein